MNNGNFIISRWNSYNADLALIPEDASALFDLYRDKTNILVFSVIINYIYKYMIYFLI